MIPTHASKTRQRLTHIDFMRAVACLLMFQRHCYDAWLSTPARSTGFFHWSQFAATLAAPSFLFLVGISTALSIESMQRRGATRNSIAWGTVRRGFTILILALVFRAQEFALGWPWSPWTDLLRVDVLNVIGVSIILLGIVLWPAEDRLQAGFAATLGAVGIFMLTPPLWTTWRPKGLPWPLESYINGVHSLGEPQPWLFPIFPWAAFAFAGLAVGSWMRSEWARQREAAAMVLVTIGGIGIYAVAWLLDASPVRLYSVYDFWHTSPNFFLMRLAVLFVILSGCYLASNYWAGNWLFNRLVQLGQSSLLVYWVHIEFAYGRFSIVPKGTVSIPVASAGLLVIIIAMLVLSGVRPWLVDQRKQLVSWCRQRMLPAREC